MDGDSHPGLLSLTTEIVAAFAGITRSPRAICRG